MSQQQKLILASTPKSTTPTLISLFGLPPLIEGEDAAAYEEMHARTSSDVKPTDFIEEMFVRDIVDITWTIFRLRRIQAAFLSDKVSREVFREVSFLDELLEDEENEEDRARLISKKSNLDMNQLHAKVIIPCLNTIESIERLMAIAESRRNATLREIGRHRAAFAQVLRQRIREIGDAEPKVVDPKESVAADTPSKEAA